MSEAKLKKNKISPVHSAKNDITKKKKKRTKFYKAVPPSKNTEKAKVQQNVPPTDPQQLSANWKRLQEILKASQPETKPSIVPKHQNGVLPKKNGENNKKNSKDSDRPSLKEKKGKLRTVPKETPLKVPGGSETKKPTAPKRKHDDAKLNAREAGKKKKSVPEERKPTEENLWFDDVDPDDIEATLGEEAAEMWRKKEGLHKAKDIDSTLVKERAFEGLTKVVAIDCEMVGVGLNGEDSILARVSLVNQFGKCIYDKYVKPTEKVTDYRTAVSGIRPQDIKDGENVVTVQREVADILKGRIVVGHAIHNDLKILLLDHPKKKIRDTQKYGPFKKAAKSGRPSLKALCKAVLDVKIQEGEHSSVQDAQATMRLYTMVKKQWEAEIKASHKSDKDKTNIRKPKSPKNKGQNLTPL